MEGDRRSKISGKIYYYTYSKAQGALRSEEYTGGKEIY